MDGDVEVNGECAHVKLHRIPHGMQNLSSIDTFVPYVAHAPPAPRFFGSQLGQ